MQYRFVTIWMDIYTDTHFAQFNTSAFNYVFLSKQYFIIK